MNVFTNVAILCLIATGWCADPKVGIRATYPDTVRMNSLNTMVIPKDSDSFLSCVVDNLPEDQRVDWIKQDMNSATNVPISTDTDSRDPYKYTIDKPAANNWRLKIQNLQVQDEALYICRVQLGGQQWANDSRTVIVVEKPQIIDIFTSSDITVDEGQSTVLKCNSSGIPHPRVSWTRMGGGVLPTGGRHLNTYHMEIGTAKYRDRGWYKCTAKNVAGIDERMVKLDVSYRPYVVPEKERVEQAVGYKVELTCIISGNPVPTDAQITWSKDDQPLADLDRYTFESSSGAVKLVARLTIHRAEYADFGTYRCAAENNKGFGHATILLTEADTPQADRKGQISGAMLVSFSLTSILMVLTVCVLHLC